MSAEPHLHFGHMLFNNPWQAATTCAAYFPPGKLQNLRGYCNADGNILCIGDRAIFGDRVVIAAQLGELPWACVGTSAKNNPSAMRFGGRQYALTCIVADAPAAIPFDKGERDALRWRCDASGIAVDPAKRFAARLVVRAHGELPQIAPVLPFSPLDPTSLDFLYRGLVLLSDQPARLSAGCTALLAAHALQSESPPVRKLVRTTRRLTDQMEREQFHTTAAILMAASGMRIFSAVEHHAAFQRSLAERLLADAQSRFADLGFRRQVRLIDDWLAEMGTEASAARRNAPGR